jgi:hypothetical protein
MQAELCKSSESNSFTTHYIFGGSTDSYRQNLVLSESVLSEEPRES